MHRCDNYVYGILMVAESNGVIIMCGVQMVAECTRVIIMCVEFRW